MQKLLDKLSPQQKYAIQLIKLSLDCFNSKDGAGLFSGVTRYNVLTSRLQIAAIQSNNAHKFWAVLLRKMCWSVPPKRYDERITELLGGDDDTGMLVVMATETVSLVTIARMLHDEDKIKNKNHPPLSDLDAEMFEKAGKLDDELFKDKK